MLCPGFVFVVIVGLFVCLFSNLGVNRPDK